MPDVSESAIAESFESAFGNAPPAEKPEPTPAQEVAAEPVPDEPVAEEAAPEEQEAVAEPEFEIEYNGARELVRGQDQIKELLQKGKDYSHKSEEVARVRDALAAHIQQTQLSQQFQQAVFGDVTELRALDSQLEQYNKVDWGAAFDSDPFNAMKLREQREQLKEQRNAKLGELNQKQQYFQQSQAQAAQQVMAAEAQALTAKLPEWRNSEKATVEKQAIASWLGNQGYNNAEIGQLVDHRAVLIARKAYLYDQLQAGKADKVKLVRDAPPVVKPGAKPTPTQSGKAGFAQFRQTFKSAGTKGQNRAQEGLLLEKLNRAFKAD